MQWTWCSRYGQARRNQARRVVLMSEFVNLAWTILITNAVLFGVVYLVFVWGD